MNKKILDATVAVLFCMGLMITSNIQEIDTGKDQINTDAYLEDAGMTEAQDAVIESAGDVEYSVTAGVNRAISEYSFTVESDEKTIIEKNQISRVATAEEIEAEENAKAEETVETDAEEAEQTAYSNRWNITLTEAEIDLLARIVWLEANGEPVEGQEAVVEVVFNRMASELYPDTLYDVLSQKNPVQFCSWKNRDIAKPTDKEYQSIYEVLNGNTNILRNDTLYFSTEPLTSRLDVKIGGHSFCY